jgi:hypothetical protein
VIGKCRLPIHARHAIEFSLCILQNSGESAFTFRPFEHMKGNIVDRAKKAALVHATKNLGVSPSPGSQRTIWRRGPITAFEAAGLKG